MAWTYTNDPANVALDRVRFMIGDIDADDPQITDEELNWLISDEGSEISAAIAAVRNLIAQYARLVDKSVDGLSISYSQRRDNLKELMATLKARQASRKAVPFAGGISQSQKDDVKDNSDRVKPRFRRGQFRLYETDHDDDYHHH